ncbi:hypothetical protein ACPXCG_18210 [Gordonia sp. DT218]|uniref:hypothetical protein n=1 Tax=unclassified Gordonia (in: high G+C Gram-positive bacteria) TaxID=2657482 RepID=UPI003CEE1616
MAWALVQGLCGLPAGALWWTAFLAVPEVGHWMINALVLAPLLAVLVAILLHTKWPLFRVFGWSLVVGTVVYGYLFTFGVLIHIGW